MVSSTLRRSSTTIGCHVSVSVKLFQLPVTPPETDGHSALSDDLVGLLRNPGELLRLLITPSVTAGHSTSSGVLDPTLHSRRQSDVEVSAFKELLRPTATPSATARQSTSF
ncbi:hypothetical protein HPB47_004184 [Ixodes persulcatus]|uniref:Uncharacterized protein n=1 Tax=Ixodes persulcatus TaxID=34615 RepID=A0AC60PGL7_IXOPE|nr:hypothetical protein HPB47_004184 [Ixodes persulcatus]